jgi:hypothetical protein
MTSYYIFAKYSGKSGITIDDIEKSANEWDGINGFPRMKNYVKKIESRKSIIEKARTRVKDDDQMRKMDNKLKKYNRLSSKKPKLGFSNNAYTLLQSKLNTAFANVHDEVRSMMSRFVENHHYEEDLKALMLEVYETSKDNLLGKNPKVILAGVFYFSAVLSDYSINMDDAVSVTGVSKPSIKEVDEILDSMKVKISLGIRKWKMNSKDSVLNNPVE